MNGRYSHAWRALRHRNFRLFFTGQGLSLIGTWVTRTASGWLVYRLTGSALTLGAVSFAGQIVPFALQPLAGVWVERLDRRKILVWTQFAACAQSFALAALTLGKWVTIPEIIALAAFQGLVNAFDTPARQSFLIQMVEDRGDLANGIAINSAMNNGARLIGPAIGGAVIAAVGEGWCFFIDGVSYFAVIASLLMMRVRPRESAGAKKTLWEQMREGWGYVQSFRPIRSILLLFFLVSLISYPYMVLLPIFAGKVLHGGPDALGWLSAASGVGALVSAVSLTFRRSVVGLGRMARTSCVALGGALIVFGLSHALWLSLLVIPFVGFGMMQVAAVSNTIIQSIVPEEMRARVMSFWAMAFFGSGPLGSFIAGAVAEKFGAPATIVATGAGGLMVAVWFTIELRKLREILRPIYRDLGFLPQE